MMNVVRRSFKCTAMIAVFALGSTVQAQDGLAGELDDLLGLGAPPAAGGEPAAAAPAAAEAAAEVPAAAEAVAEVPAAAEAVAEVPAAAEAVAEVPEAAAEVPVAAEEAVANVEVAAEAAVANVEVAAEEAVAAVEAAAEAPAVEDPLAAIFAPVEAPKPVEAPADEPVAAEAVAEVPPLVDEGVAAIAAPIAAVVTPVEAVAGLELADDASATDKVVSEIDTLEQMRRRALEAHGRASIENARRALRDGNYPEAQKLYEEAGKFIVRRPGNEAVLDEAEKGAAEAIYRQATVLWKKGDRDRAVQLARQAREKGHPKAPKLVAELQKEIDNPPEPPPPQAAKRWNENTYRKTREEVQRKLGRAREYYITGEYELARSELELIIKDNPYDQDALQMLKRVTERTYDVSSDEFSTTRTRMIQEVRNAWTPRRYAIDVVTPEDGAASGKIGSGTKVGKDGAKSDEELTIDKMKSITLPEINFRAANINDVVGFFESASREFDSQDLPPERRGVSFVLKMPQQAAAAVQDDPFAPVAQGGGIDGVPPITFSARFVNLHEALKIITDVAGLKFRVRGTVVVIMPLNMAADDMVVRAYTVLPAIGDRASSVSRELGTGNRGAPLGGGFLTPEDAGDSGQIDWKRLFTDMGVKWPDGSSISYVASINKMRVLNTPENLADFERALEDLNVTPRQIEIEARFVEVSQTDLESIGFEWLLTDDWEIANNKNNPQQRIKINSGSGTSGLRYLTSETPVNPSMSQVADNLISAASVLTNPELSFVLHMLSQRANTDLLSAPKVVTKNSQEAIIKVVTEYIYPTEYNITENSQSGANSDVVQENIPMVEPGGFEMREVGVILQVVPEVSEDGQMIDLTLNPQIISEPTWEDYGFDYYSSRSPTPVHVAMRQPFFQVRSISTGISIYNGATVVMGGMITEARTEVDDKIPLLGDIPLIGRLFRSRYEQSEKRNLLIFVTARLVDPAGRSLKTQASGAASQEANDSLETPQSAP